MKQSGEGQEDLECRAGRDWNRDQKLVRATIVPFLTFGPGEDFKGPAYLYYFQ
jgi:hypothetical protein